MRNCPICHSDESSAELFQNENIDLAQISKFSFSSRKLPEYMCHKLLRCLNCDLVYACNPPEQLFLAEAYHKADFDSSAEGDDAALSYIKVLKPALLQLNNKLSALEIGAGTGVFLELLKAEGFEELIGIEPSIAAILAAPVHRKKWLKNEIFTENHFNPGSFDLICCFMTMEHIQDPLAAAQSVYRLLKPGGLFVTVTHDYRSWINRLLGKKSPIIDIEHMQLFSSHSITRLFMQAGFNNIKVSKFQNKYYLNYWLRLMPIPRPFKQFLIKFLNFIGLGYLRISLNVGNVMTYGVRTN